MRPGKAWAPDAPDELTANLTLAAEPGAPVRATLFGASTLEEAPTRELLEEFIERAGRSPTRPSSAPACPTTS